MRFMQSNLISALGSFGGLVAFVAAFGWLLVPVEHFQVIDVEALEHFNSVLESVALFGMSPWVMFGLSSLALAVIYYVIFNLNILQVVLAVFSTAMALLALNTLSFFGCAITLILLCCLLTFFLKAR
ncbi:hypothetical protein JQC92_01365 [Shewanella sp. 202IG2-18]|uniref:hypothetical protein n=1 Tax=Parashewanella hymeniacidonis TaxID=2807618 RepID=UPI001960545B|nr:hypothetical protein [Parashewanella hymeniacidonis]MBM7070692.1 hypothetical protein [Parashewanella hymeniacidonis]